MTLPTSAPISLDQVATELGLGLPISLGDTAVRNLAGISSGAISMISLLGKSASIVVTGNSAAASYTQSSSNYTATQSVSVTPSGGSGGYTYAWSLTDAQGCTLGATNGQSCSVSHQIPRTITDPGSAIGTLQCVVSDGSGHSTTATGITCDFTWDQ